LELLSQTLIYLKSSDVSDQGVISCSQDTKLLDLCEQLPNGLDFNLEKNGARLSGGQRQRLGIARALYTKPSLIFDEATLTLGAETEYLIGKSIQKLKTSVTIIIITFRLSTAKNVDMAC
jgi:ABC-type bacteriocin/lantibiotic exporter with double-glycine peptidase domain